MAETQTTTQRADLDILEDIEHLIAQYPPTRKDQHAIHIDVKTGHVTVTGHVQTPNTRHYFLGMLPGVEGVQTIDAERFFDDESTRLEIGKVLPVGVRLAKIQYGAAILSGKLPDGVSGGELAAHVSLVPGVSRVVTNFQK